LKDTRFANVIDEVLSVVEFGSLVVWVVLVTELFGRISISPLFEDDLAHGDEFAPEPSALQVLPTVGFLLRR